MQLIDQILLSIEKNILFSCTYKKYTNLTIYHNKKSITL